MPDRMRIRHIPCGNFPFFLPSIISILLIVSTGNSSVSDQNTFASKTEISLWMRKDNDILSFATLSADKD